MKLATSTISQPSLETARTLESGGDYKGAAAVYEKLLPKTTIPLYILARLMLLYRKQKKFRQEIITINKAIKIHEQHYVATKLRNNKATELSRQLGIALGITDKKGNNYYKPEEVLKLEKRRNIATKRMGG